MKGSSYRKAGVDIVAGEEVAQAAKAAARRTMRREVVSGIGGFGAAFRLPAGYRQPLLVAATDGVGTKLQIALLLKRHDTVGIDLVAMNVNDILTLGAEPLAFLDYYVTDRLQPRVASQVLTGIAEGCRLAGCALVGGETAEHPGCFPKDEYDLAGFTVGVVEEDEVVDGRDIRAGDVILGLPSSGLHSNGFSLVRDICFRQAGLKASSRPPELATTLGEELLRPTRIYVKLIRALPRPLIKGMAHITGGGLLGNVPRMFPSGLGARIDTRTWQPPAVFPMLQRLGTVETEEMFRTFNMGIGFVIVTAPENADALLRSLRRRREPAFVIGEVTRLRRGAKERVELVPGR